MPQRRLTIEDKITEGDLIKARSSTKAVHASLTVGLFLKDIEKYLRMDPEYEGIYRPVTEKEMVTL